MLQGISKKMPLALRKPWNSSRGNTALTFLAFVLVLGMMIGSIYYPFPSGQSMTVTGFIQLWFREVITLAVIVVVFIIVGFSWLRRLLKQRRRGEHNAP